MKIYVGVTDNDWYDYLSSLQPLDEVNFWQPSAYSPLKLLPQGGLFLFKLHSPRNYIAGGGIFASATTLPISLAWEAFQQKNGAPTYEEMRRLIVEKRGAPDNHLEDFQIGCILLTQPFFFKESQWFPPPEWSPNIVRGKSYDVSSEAGKFILRKVEQRLAAKQDMYIDKEGRGIIEPHARYGEGILVKPRLGQGSFRILVTDAYNRSCAVTHERALPVLEAVHIRSYSDGGPHAVNNGLLLRSDMHKLFDKGYMTITPQLHIEVSRRIREEFDNGEYYFTFHGKQAHSPRISEDRPSPEFLTWHNENIFKG